MKTMKMVVDSHQKVPRRIRRIREATLEAPDVEEAPTEIVGWTPLKRLIPVANGRE